jgi:hypothetical protein|mmetsp:Transcript_27378/g.38729  ORF Transcript_27378/g.38729 Transcript_27378/m.38729 type:complete len:277 (-) Transcript_27378:250-1080(-)|eukprot:CAMPEP_0175102580 /NCGR_PEP_ID=MMETSP0086_2-20121207/8536_1 /TAXON_ID=136419 /ORGANISM="Unknown Unknown, Strain D1" /LENGTH=276 /DNA_ID=CAMNT_0016377447 /DNA_START=36 /DNA_END=866 /DNA_ORIENTATION=-
MSFVEKLGEEELAFFNDVASKPFSQQAVSFLNAYWDEVGDQADFIFTVAWETMKYADMHAKGISLIHKYEEGVDLDFNIGLYFYEKLVKFVDETKDGWKDDQWKKSHPEMMTAIVRKKELKEKVDVNFDGRISFLEYLLYQYRAFANPADFATRSMKAPDEHPEIKKARLALEEVNARIRAYEEEKCRLEEESKLPGVKGLKAKNMLAQLDASPLMEELNKALITAEAALRRVNKMFGKGGSHAGGDSESAGRSDGAMWWMNKDLEVKKARYGRKK